MSGVSCKKSYFYKWITSSFEIQFKIADQSLKNRSNRNNWEFNLIDEIKSSSWGGMARKNPNYEKKTMEKEERKNRVEWEKLFRTELPFLLKLVAPSSFWLRTLLKIATLFFARDQASAPIFP